MVAWPLYKSGSLAIKTMSDIDLRTLAFRSFGVETRENWLPERAFQWIIVFDLSTAMCPFTLHAI